jgi:alkylation response protein AidB-like acyl-CoA dehydrogenase
VGNRRLGVLLGSGAQAKFVTMAKPVRRGYLLNGRRCFISNGALADRVTVYAKLEGEALDSWTCFLVEKGTRGLSVGRSERKMGQRSADASELIFEEVFVPRKNPTSRGRRRNGGGRLPQRLEDRHGNEGSA